MKEALQRRAAAITPIDRFVGEAHREEARRLEKVLGTLIPELRPIPELHLVPMVDQGQGNDP
jgi:hypothetical protein